jgi:hypothetical protein
MSKVKMRCARCGKPFKSSGAKQTLCPECEVKARRERANEKVAGAKAATSPVAVAHAPRIVGPGAAILGATPTPPTFPPVGNESGDGGSHRDHPQHGRQPPARRDAHGEQRATASAPIRTQTGKGDHADKQSRPPAERQQRAEKRPKPAPFMLSDEARQTIEARYLELAQPVEFDGIRTQIAGELGVPKHVVKQVVRELRTHRQLPSWWELKSYTGSSTELSRIRDVYLPHLPVPPIGVHKVIAEQLGVEPADVYHAIRRIRAEMRLPQYNAPELHEATPDVQPRAEAMVGQEGPA